MAEQNNTGYNKDKKGEILFRGQNGQEIFAADALQAVLILLSREIRTPLHSILGNARLAEGEADNPEAMKEYLRKITVSAEYMRDTIADMVRVLGIIRGEDNLSPQEIDLRLMVEDIAESVTDRLKERSLSFRYDISELEIPEIFADRECLNQILGKLLVNTLGYMVRNGKLELKVATSPGEGGRADLVISVTGTGFAIDTVWLRNIFESDSAGFYTAVSDPYNADMGLLILQNYVYVMGGTIGVEDLGNGVDRLTVRLKTAVPEARTGEELTFGRQIYRDGRFSGCRALIADDNNMNLELTKRLLERAGFEVYAVENGEEAVRMWKKERGTFDVVILDLLMPVMDGCEAARRIRRSSPRTLAMSVPIVALTATAFGEDVIRSRRAGINRHLVKPIDPDNLYEVLGECIYHN